MIQRMEFAARRKALQKQIRELHDSGKSPQEIGIQMIVLDSMMEDLEKEEEEFERQLKDE